MSDYESTPVHAILRSLLPPPGYETGRALLCTYSLDLVVLAAMLAHLAGFDGDDVRVTPVTLATALNDLAGRVTVLAQAGRVKAPPELGPFHALLLRHVQVRSGPEPGAHWHPKLVIVRFRPLRETQGPALWRVWLGSHNFVRTTSWELGGAVASGGRTVVPGLSDDLVRFLRTCGWDPGADVVEEIRKLTWDAGDPIAVARVALPGSPLPRWIVPRQASEATVVSPFLDGATLLWLAKMLPKDRRLLTNREAVLELARAAREDGWQALRSFKVLATGAPSELASTLSVGEEKDEDEDGVDGDRGLHAKALLVRSGASTLIQFGSANATRRGIQAPGEDNALNHEVVCEVRVPPAWADALLAPVLAAASPLHPDELDRIRSEAQVTPEGPGPTVAEDLAELGGTLSLSQSWAEGSLTVNAESSPNLARGDRLLISALLDRGPATAWPEGARAVSLPPIPATDRSDFLVLHLERPGAETARTLVRAPCSPPRDADGDAALLRRALGPHGLLLWLRGRLDDVSLGLDDWDRPPRSDAKEAGDSETGGGHGVADAAIPLESILRAWVRDRPRGDRPVGLSELARIDLDIRRMRMAELATEEPSDSVEDRSARARLRAFLDLWNRVRPELLPRADRR